ncbi:MAG: hypothetical protein A2168_06975 [Planctomycetes bacterium RBG_13_50_24]|nr:MAG: hypothetical protein A2168_06975 [Planctomycetes bacterium RBG_13_50_24]
MVIEAPVSKFTKTNLQIYIVLCIAVAAWFAYDGYINKTFIEKNTNENGTPNITLIMNQKLPPFLAGAAVFFGMYLFAVKSRKLAADENELVFSAKEKIPYDSIQSINKTYFEKKGFFIITYKDENGKQLDRKLSDRKYDNLAAVLDHLVAKIT